MSDSFVQTLGLCAAVILPLWNIPLIARIVQRKSSEDISLWWALGVWVCLIFMAPSGFLSKDIVWKVFNITNFILFSAVVIFTLVYHKGSASILLKFFQGKSRRPNSNQDLTLRKIGPDGK